MTFAQILADIYRRTGFASSPTADVVTRIKSFVNETQQEILREPGMEFLLNDIVSLTSVASQATYGLPVSVGKIKVLYDSTTRMRLHPMSLGEYRERYPDPTGTTGTPVRWVDLGFDAVNVEPSDASAIYVKSSSASDTGTAYLEGLRTGGIPFTDSVTMTGATAVQFPTYADVISVTKFYMSAVAVGTVTLREDSGTGTTLATVSPGYSYSRYRRIALAPTPASAITYSLDVQRNVTDMVQDTDQPLLPEAYHHMLAIGGRMKEYEKTADARWNLARGEFDRAMKKLKFWLYDASVGVPNMRGPAISTPSILEGTGSVVSSSSSSSTTPLAVTAGGTGFASYAIGDTLYADTTTTLAKLGIGSSGAFMRVGAGGVPTWSSLTIPATMVANRIPYTTGADVLGSSANLTFDGSILTLAADLKFTDATFDIGKSGATRPRDFFLSRNATIGGTLGVTGLSTLNTAGALTTKTTTLTSTGTQNNLSPGGSGNLLVLCNPASDLTITGISGGSAGQRITFYNVNATSLVKFSHNSGSSSDGNKLINLATTAATPVAASGWATYEYDNISGAGFWRLVSHEQGAWITPTFSAGDFTGAGSMTWTVASSDRSVMKYKLQGKTMNVQYEILTTSVGGTPSSSLQIGNGQWGGFTIAANDHQLMALRCFNNSATGANQVGIMQAGSGLTLIGNYLDGTAATAWTASADLTGVIGMFSFEVA